MSEPMWLQCLHWLKRLGLVPSDHKLFHPNATPDQLASLLRDGVILCLILNKLKPDTIDILRDVKLRPQNSQYLCYANILLFQQKCQSEFKLRKSDICGCEQVYNMEKFDETLRTLSILSRSEIARQFSGQNGFPQKSFSAAMLREEEPTYINIAAESSFISHNVENMYEDLTVLEDYYGYNIGGYGSHHEGETGPVQTASIEPPEREEVNFVIQELIEFEEKYVVVLHAINCCFVMKLGLATPPLMPPVDFNTVFMCNFASEGRDVRRVSVFQVGAIVR